MYGGLRGSRDRSILGSRAERGAVGRMDRSMGGPRNESSSVCHEVDTGKDGQMETESLCCQNNQKCAKIHSVVHPTTILGQVC